jgi:predicted XRE-type DNA-binding protein
MKKKARYVVTRTAEELAEALDLSPEDAVEIEVKSELNAKIIEVTKRKGLTHAAIAKLAHTSRTRVTALLNGNTRNISASLMIRILASLGIRTRITYVPTRLAA